MTSVLKVLVRHIYFRGRKINHMISKGAIILLMFFKEFCCLGYTKQEAKDKLLHLMLSNLRDKQTHAMTARISDLEIAFSTTEKYCSGPFPSDT